MGVQQSIDTGLRTLVCLTVLPAALIACCLWILILAAVGAPRKRVDAVYHGFARLCVRVAGTRIVSEGRENIDPSRAYVIVPNHESSWDPVMQMAVMDQLAVRFVVKKEMIRIPIFGNALMASGSVRVERKDTKGDTKRIQEGMLQRDPGVSMLFYAEGTRSRDGSFRPIKKGAFMAAISEQLPILPVATAGTYRLWTPETVRIRKGTVVMLIGEPISVEGLTVDARDQLLEQTAEAVRELRTRARRRLRALGHDPGGID